MNSKYWVSDVSMTSSEIASKKRVVVKRNCFNKGDRGAEKGCFNQICILKSWATVNERIGSGLKLVPVHIYIYIFIYLFIYIYVCVYIYIYVYVHIYIYICIFICKYEKDIYIYINT